MTNPREKLTGWKQCTTKFPGDPRIPDEFETLFTAHGAPEVMALFARTSDDFKNKIFLLSPDAAKYSAALPGEWVDAGDPTEHEWSLVVSRGDLFKRFGLRSPSWPPRPNL
jgi:hypothetical protein